MGKFDFLKELPLKSITKGNPSVVYPPDASQYLSGGRDARIILGAINMDVPPLHLIQDFQRRIHLYSFVDGCIIYTSSGEIVGYVVKESTSMPSGDQAWGVPSIILTHTKETYLIYREVLEELKRNNVPPIGIEDYSQNIRQRSVITLMNPPDF